MEHLGNDHDLLIRIDEKLNLLITQAKDLEIRIRALESTKSKIWGVAIILSALASAGVAMISALIQRG